MVGQGHREVRRGVVAADLVLVGVVVVGVVVLVAFAFASGVEVGIVGVGIHVVVVVAVEEDTLVVVVVVGEGIRGVVVAALGVLGIPRDPLVRTVVAEEGTAVVVEGTAFVRVGAALALVRTAAVRGTHPFAVVALAVVLAVAVGLLLAHVVVPVLVGDTHHIVVVGVWAAVVGVDIHHHLVEVSRNSASGVVPVEEEVRPSH